MFRVCNRHNDFASSRLPMKPLKEIFPRASASFLKANPPSSPSPEGKSNVQVNQGGKELNLRRARGRMNKTEADYAMILEAIKQNGEILRWEFEGITLRFQGVKYTPDFFVLVRLHQFTPEWIIPEIKFIEIKGRYILGHFERAIERFRHARTYYPEFQFEMMQKTKEGWKQIL